MKSFLVRRTLPPGSLVSDVCSTAVVPKEHWSYPPWVNQTLAAEGRQAMLNKGIICSRFRSPSALASLISPFLQMAAPRATVRCAGTIRVSSTSKRSSNRSITIGGSSPGSASFATLTMILFSS